VTLVVAFALFGAALISLCLTERWVTRLPLSPALLYLGAGYAAGAVLGVPPIERWIDDAAALRLVTEVVVLVSLISVGLHVRVWPPAPAWKVALRLAGPAMVVTIAVAAAAAHWVLALPWAGALVLAAVLAPTDPVLASEVQVDDEKDRDAVRLSLTAEGGLNDGTALPAVMLGLGALGLHELGTWGVAWAWHDLLWPIGGGALLGVAIGLATGWALRWRIAHGDAVRLDELLYFGLVALCAGVALGSRTSTFVVTFAAGCTLYVPLLAGEGHRGQAGIDTRSELNAATDLMARMSAFGLRVERLAEAAIVLGIGAALSAAVTTGLHWLFGLLVVLVARPVAVLATVRLSALPATQRRLVAWFGIRGIGSLFYLAYVLEHGVDGPLARDLVAATLAAIALSIVLHGVSATPLMRAYRRRRESRQR
jgi:NhaP-type Na+/H+ or K+/H+ antiporter